MSSNKNDKIHIRGRTYNLDDLSDLTSIQAVLVPDNWPTKKSEGVKHFISLRNMLCMQLSRHLAANFKIIAKTALEEGENGDPAQVNVGFGFTVDFTAPTVATISAHKLGFSMKHETKGKPVTHDVNQGEFLDVNMDVILDTKEFAKENDADDKPADPAASPTDDEGRSVEANDGSDNDGKRKPKSKATKKADK